MKRDRTIGDFLIARGGPFYELQHRLGLLHENVLRSGRRALAFVGLAWGVPLLLVFIVGDAFRPVANKPYLLDLTIWSRFFIAVGLFVLVERQVEERLHLALAQFVRAPSHRPEII